MDSTLKVRGIESVYKDILRGRLLLVHKLQRKEGQWSNKQKFDLIDSVFRNIPLNPTYMIEERGNVTFGPNDEKKTVMLNFVIDGVQRLSTIRDYIAGKFKISKSYDNMLGSLIIDGEEVNINGKKFSELDDWIKEYFLSRELQLYVLTNFTDEEVREMFKRQNAGSPLTNAQKNVVLLSDELRDTIDTISKHNFWKKCKLSSNDFKKDAIRNVVLQCMWSVSDFPITDFLAKENGGIYKDFVPWAEEESKFIGLSEDLIDTLNELDSCIEQKKCDALTKASISAVVYGMNYAIKHGRILDKFKVMINNFISHYYDDEWSWYRSELTDSIYQHKKVMDRFEIFKQLADNASMIDYIGIRKKEWEDRMKGVTEVNINGETSLFIEETEEDKAARLSVNIVEEEISDEELDRIGMESAKKAGLL